MQRAAQILGVFVFLLAAGWLLVPRGSDDSLLTGSIPAAMVALVGEPLSCDQALYLEELELATGLSCS